LSNIVEIERKFLLIGYNWKNYENASYEIDQHYLVDDGKKNVRIRKKIYENRTACVLTIKSCNSGMSRIEVEKIITLKEFNALKGMSIKSISKRRSECNYWGKIWEVDVFPDGLVLAEIELRSEDEDFKTPGWIGEEVTNDKSYYNSEMST